MKKLKLSHKFIIGVLITPLLLIIVITIYTGINRISNINSEKATASLRIAQSVSEKIDRNFYERFGDVQAFAVNYYAKETTLGDSISENAQSFINTMVNYYVLYDLIMIVDRYGKVKACNTVSKEGKPLLTNYLIGLDFSNEDWFKKCKNISVDVGGAYYSDFEINDNVKTLYKSDGRGMSYAAPIFDAEGNMTGVWYNYASWKEVTEGIRDEALVALRKSEPNAEIILLNSKNVIIDATDKNLIMNYTFPILNDLSGEFSFSSGEFKITKENYIIGLYRSTGAYTYKGKNWSTLVFVPLLKYNLSNFISWDMILLDIFFLIIAILIATYFSKHLIQKIYFLKNSIISLSKGNLDTLEITFSKNDEIGEMADSLTVLRNGLEKTAQFANEVGEGYFQTEFILLGEEDILGNSLLKMRNNLSKASEEDEKRRWATEGIAKFAEIIRVENDTKSLSENILLELIKYVDLNQGAFFITTHEGGKTYLDLIGCIAYNRKKFLSSRLELHSSLPGRAYLEGEMIILTELPKDYITITSGLGDASPSFLILIPLKNNGTIVGVIELASFERLPDYRISFLEKISENITSSISSMFVNEQTKKLLVESQIREEELKAQEEEIRQNLEELQATQEEMNRKGREYEIIIEELKRKVL